MKRLQKDNHEVADFWGFCYQKQLIEPLKRLRKKGDLKVYGLCAPLREKSSFFDYGIGILLDENVLVEEVKERLQEEVREYYQLWETDPCTYVVFRCFGDDHG